MKRFKIITGRNEVVAKVMFLLVSVILLTGGCAIPACIAGGIPASLAAGLLGGTWSGGVCLVWGVPGQGGLLLGE